jgi:hypothetical protein
VDRWQQLGRRCRRNWGNPHGFRRKFRNGWLDIRGRLTLDRRCVSVHGWKNNGRCVLDRRIATDRRSFVGDRRNAGNWWCIERRWNHGARWSNGHGWQHVTARPSV